MYTDEMMHAATKIMQNRADQLGLDEDELMHYGRKGMKWGKDIFAQDDSEKKQSGGPWGNNAFTNAINNPKYNPIKKAQLEKKKEELLEKATSVKPMKDNFHGNLGIDADPARLTDKLLTNYSDMTPATSNRISQETAGGREIVTNTNHGTYKYDNKNGDKPSFEVNKTYYNPKYGYSINGYSDDYGKENARRQELQERWEKNKENNRLNEAAKAGRDLGDFRNSISNSPNGTGLKDSGFQSSKLRFDNNGNYIGSTSAYDVPIETSDGKSGWLMKGTAKEIRENERRNEQRVKQQEAIAKYGDQGTEKNDEQRIAEKARGQYIREEQKKQRQDELNKKKQELLEKARREKAQRTKGLFSPDVTREHQQAMVPVREGKAGEILENSYGPDNTVFKTDAKNQSRVNFDRYKKQHNAR